jgi:hypothetical protein
MRRVCVPAGLVENKTLLKADVFHNWWSSTLSTKSSAVRVYACTLNSVARDNKATVPRAKNNTFPMIKMQKNAITQPSP